MIQRDRRLWQQRVILCTAVHIGVGSEIAMSFIYCKYCKRQDFHSVVMLQSLSSSSSSTVTVVENHQQSRCRNTLAKIKACQHLSVDEEYRVRAWKCALILVSFFFLELMGSCALLRGTSARRRSSQWSNWLWLSSKSPLFSVFIVIIYEQKCGNPALSSAGPLSRMKS